MGCDKSGRGHRVSSYPKGGGLHVNFFTEMRGPISFWDFLGS